MSRKRQLSPDFFGDEEIAEFPYSGRLFYVGTWCFCEDTGIFELKFKTLKASIFPHDDLDIKPLYEQIRDKGKYIEYRANGKVLAFIKGFHNRQIIQWPSKSFLPLPPEPYLSLIPLKIRKLNESSSSNQAVLTVPSQRIELNKLELTEEEIKGLKKIYHNKSKLENHLKGRNFTPEQIGKILKENFPEYEKGE